jgi:hypothetical protein
MWNYIQDDLSSIVYIDPNKHTLVIKIFGLKDQATAEMFASYAMNLMNFDYDSVDRVMPSKMIH